jgi:SAM-dependent MidA family methyltransferase
MEEKSRSVSEMETKPEAGNAALIRMLRQEIETRGAIPFDRYMSACLYHPQYGYYTSDKPKVGKDGDFYTSAYVGSLMGEMLAAYAVRSGWGGDAGLDVVEWGGGTGRMANDFLDALQREAPERYAAVRFTCIEHSDYHRRLQRETCRRHADRMRWLSAEAWRREAARSDRPVVLYSNELLDAFPVKRAVYRSGEWREIFVGWDAEGGAFTEVEREPTPELDRYLRQGAFGPEWQEWPEGRRIEACLDGLAWYAELAGCLPAGSVVVSIDYGGERSDLYGPHRLNGTFRCYYRHQAHDDPYIRIGEQDMTADVNFDDYRETGIRAGMETLLYATQKRFLVEAGILTRLQDHAITDPFHPVVRRNRAIRQLLLGEGMGERFKVLIQRKGRTTAGS